MITSRLDQRSRRRYALDTVPNKLPSSSSLTLLLASVVACILVTSVVGSSSSSSSSLPPSAFVSTPPPSSFGDGRILRDKVVGPRTTLIDVVARRGENYPRRRPTIGLNNNGLSLSSTPNDDNSYNNDDSYSSSSRTTSSAAATRTTKTTITTSPMRYVRIEPRGNIHGSKRRYDIQTAVTTFTKRIPNTSNDVITVDLYAHIHFGTQSYFAYHNTPEFNEKYNKVFYELIVSDELLQYHHKDNTRSLIPRKDGTLVLQSSPTDARTAQQHQLVCQVDVIDYAQNSKKWIHADLTREEFIDQKNLKKGKKSTVNQQQQQQPLWSLASTITTSLPFYNTIETFSALLRPSTPTTPLTTPITRRLFSNLFLPGDTFTSIIRALLWTTVPSPELSIMVLDWSSLSPRPSGGISKIALPVLECILTGKVGEGRKLVFGQMIVSGQGSTTKTDDSFLVGRRNEHAINILNESISKQQQGTGTKRNALLYGAMHCQDLHTKLQSLGFTPTKTQWRTAWCVDIPNYGSGMKNVLQQDDNTKQQQLSRPFELAPFAIIPSNASSPIALTVGLVILPLYLFLGGLDWLITVQDVGKSFFSSDSGQIMDGIVELVLYLIRHVALYVGLAKFVVEWDSNGGDGGGGLFGAEE